MPDRYPHLPPAMLQHNARTSRGERPDTRRLECLPCEAVTVHVPGRVTPGQDGAALVRWWKCTECDEGEAIV